MMLGGGGSGGSVRAKSTMIRYNNQMVALVNGSGTNYAEQKWVWSLVNVDDFGRWRRNCNDRRVMETKNLGMNGMDYFVFFSR